MTGLKLISVVALDVRALRENYDELASKSEFITLKEAVPVQLATWDDHDYCRNGEFLTVLIPFLVFSL
jgi:hypothetical protein